MRVRTGWRRNLGLKILSVLLGLLLWAYVHGARTVERETELPVRVVNLPDSLRVAGALPPSARVLVAGPAQEIFLNRLWPAAFLKLDLARARPPSVRLVLSPADCVLGAGKHLRVVHVLEPASVEVAIRRRAGPRVP